MRWVLLTLVIGIIVCVPSNAPYIKADKRPLNIAHRGLCSILPENTLQSFEASLYQGADFFELDVVYTKEKFPLVMHDPFLSRLTNIKNLSSFSTRYSTRSYGGSNKTDWWTDQFTLSELKTMGIKQAQAVGRISIFDYQFTFPTLNEVIQMCIDFNMVHKGKRNPDGRLGGILIEAKDSQMYRNLYGLEMGQTILKTLKKYGLDSIQNATKYCPIYLHSFDFGTIKYWHNASELPRNFLATKSTVFNLTEVNAYATGLGLDDSSIWNYTSNQVTPILKQMKDLDLIVHIWTFKDDYPTFNSSNNLQMYSKAQKLLKLDGVITEFADVFAPISQLYRQQEIELEALVLPTRTRSLTIHDQTIM